MSYQNAKDILPKQIVAQIQQYIQTEHMVFTDN